jgi:hypothetical protein
VAKKKERRVAEAKAAYAPKPDLQEEPRRPDAELLADFDWLQENRGQLDELYQGRWIAIADRRVVGEGARLPTAVGRARKAGYQDPLVHKVRPRHLQNTLIVASWL